MNPDRRMDFLIGQYINEWFIIEARPNKRKGYVLARCSCGNIKEIRGRSIRNGTSTNCGCQKAKKLRNRQRIPGTDSAVHCVFRTYKNKAIRTGKEFELNIDDFKIITSKNCYYCNASPSNRTKKHKYIYYYNGIDRVNNEKGYLKDNVVPCCLLCNTAKGSITINMLKKVLEFLNA